MVDDLGRSAGNEHLTGGDEITAVGDPQQFDGLMVGDQDADPVVRQIANDALDVVDCDRIDAR